MTAFNIYVAKLGVVFGLAGGVLNALTGNIAWALLCCASTGVSLINLRLLKEPPNVD